MPHLIVEYSANLEPDLNIKSLIQALHECAVSMEALPTGGIRVRAARRDEFMVGDGDPSNGFVNIVLRIAKGRSIELRKEIGQTLFAVLTENVQEIYDRRPMSLSFEIQEINPETRWNQGNIRDYMALSAEGNQK